jgi:prepilin-type N-terminal cleavage/methylation domain-containing protein
MKQNRGFTLIEVLVAAGVLGLVATALFGLLGKSLSNLRKVEELHRYELAATDVMNRVLLLPGLPAPSTAQGVVDNFPGTWTVKVETWAPKTVKKDEQAIVKVKVVVNWPGQSGQHSLELESLKVVKVDEYDLQSRIQTAYPQ